MRIARRLMVMDDSSREKTISKVACQMIIQKSNQRIVYENRNRRLFYLSRR